MEKTSDAARPRRAPATKADVPFPRWRLIYLGSESCAPFALRPTGNIGVLVSGEVFALLLLY